jgi:hypothetical protein
MVSSERAARFYILRPAVIATGIYVFVAHSRDEEGERTGFQQTCVEGKKKICFAQDPRS